MSYSEEIERSQYRILAALGIKPTGDEWADYVAVATALAIADPIRLVGSAAHVARAWNYLADQVMAGFKVDPEAPEAPTTQLMQWQHDRMIAQLAAIIDPEETARRMRAWLDKVWGDLKAIADQIVEYTQPQADDHADPPPARPEARNENRPRQKHESPRWQPRRRK